MEPFPSNIAVRPDGRLLVGSHNGMCVELMTRFGSLLQGRLPQVSQRTCCLLYTAPLATALALQLLLRCISLYLPVGFHTYLPRSRARYRRARVWRGGARFNPCVEGVCVRLRLTLVDGSRRLVGAHACSMLTR